MLTIDTIPLCQFWILDLRFQIKILSRTVIQNPKSKIGLLVLFMQPMAAAATAKLFKLKPVRRVLFVLGRHVITLFALGALQNNVISRHKSSF
jgi:hypothetical protein